MPKALLMARALDFTLKRALLHDIKERLALMSSANICAEVIAQGAVPIIRFPVSANHVREAHLIWKGKINKHNSLPIASCNFRLPCASKASDIQNKEQFSSYLRSDRWKWRSLSPAAQE